jgi:hypothetical protein
MANRSPLSDLVDLGTVLRWSMITGAFAIVAASTPSPLAQMGISALVFITAFAAGAAIGFIFSVPRAVDPSAITGAAPPAADPATGANEAVATPAATPRGRLLNTNTALERISEWLATMLVGVGLSQLYNLNNLLIGFRDFLGQFGPPGSFLPAIGPLILIAGAIAGFLFMYVYTRLVLPPAFYQAEANNLGDYLGPDASRAVRAAAQEAVTAQTTEGVATNLAEGFTLKALTRADRPSAENAVSLMLDLLYKPDGYRKVIELGGDLATSRAAARADFWFYLAAAFGQLHAATMDDRERAQARQQAINAARRSIGIDPSMKARLRLLTTKDTGDDDLATLADDPELRALID